MECYVEIIRKTSLNRDPPLPNVRHPQTKKARKDYRMVEPRPLRKTGVQHHREGKEAQLSEQISVLCMHTEPVYSRFGYSACIKGRGAPTILWANERSEDSNNPSENAT